MSFIKILFIFWLLVIILGAVLFIFTSSISDYFSYHPYDIKNNEEDNNGD